MNERTIIQITPAVDWWVAWRDEADVEDYGFAPLSGWALCEGWLFDKPRARYVVGLIANDEVGFADCLGPDIEYIHASDLAEARKRAEIVTARLKGKAA